MIVPKHGQLLKLGIAKGRMGFFAANLYNLLEAATGSRPAFVISLVIELNNKSLKLPVVNAFLRGDSGLWCDD